MDIIVLSDSDDNDDCEKILNDSINDFLFTNTQCEGEKVRKGKDPTKKIQRKRTAVQEERAEKKKKLDREKALKTISSKVSKNIQPGTCMKLIDVILDKNLETHPFYLAVITALRDHEINYQLRTNKIKNSIIWQRRAETYELDENNRIETTVRTQEEDQMLIICTNDEILDKVKNDRLLSYVGDIKKSAPGLTSTLLLFDCKPKGKQSKTLNLALVECQIMYKCGNRWLTDSTELAQTIYQYTKSIGEKLYKLEREKPLLEFDWYVFGDKKNSVGIDEQGNGCKRLWKQQLCQFNLISLEIAESIGRVYSSPWQLHQAYENASTVQEGISLLKDIPVRRVAGPLTSNRKIGPLLSKKIYLACTASTGSTLLTG